MNDYISRKAVWDLIYELQNFYENEEKESEDFNSKMMYVGSINALTAMEDGLSDIPPADVRLVVYAEPVRIFNDPYTGRMFTTCSRCTGKISPKDKFCKHCGADMRGKSHATP